jgi:hypothetical protein
MIMLELVPPMIVLSLSLGLIMDLLLLLLLVELSL